MEFDFSGYATRTDVRCSDGRTIKPDAFKHNDSETVPLVWQHRHNAPENILGHAVLEHRDDGVYAYCKFNDTKAGKNAKKLVQHGDIRSLSIYANKLVQKGSDVIHGFIREVSLVVSGANPEAFIDNIAIAHSDGTYTYSDDAAIIYNEETLDLDDHIEHEEDSMEYENEELSMDDIYHSMTDEQKHMLHTMVEYAATGEDPEDNELQHKDEEKTLKDVFETLNEEQKNMVYIMLATATEDKKEDKKEGNEAKTNESNKKDIKHEEGDDDMKKNIFDNTDGVAEGHTLSHADIKDIFSDATKYGSLKESVLAHAEEYGVRDIELLFPEATNVTPTPEMISRNMEWVSGVLKETRKTPFSRIKSTAIDVTAEEARARGYVKTNMKKEEIVSTLRRTTSPTTIYKKQKLDRDDILDITDFDIVMWLKMEMRLMLDEEIARAILIGDGRDIESSDKINEQSIRPIAFDNQLYSHKVVVPAEVSGHSLIEVILKSRKFYKGKGKPKFYTTESLLVDLLLLKDKIGRRLYNTETELAQALRVSEIVSVEPMEDEPSVLGIMVNLNDYTIGTNRGGEVTLFDDFDIDFNQHKYLIETRMAGALTAPKTALVFLRDEGIEVEPNSPSFNPDTGVVTIPAKTGVIYKIAGVLEDTEVASGEMAPIEKGATIEIVAEPDVGFHFPAESITEWEYTRSL